MFRRHYYNVALWLLLTMSVGLFASSLSARAQEDSLDSLDSYQLLELFGEIMEHIKKEYIEDVEDKELLESAIRGMLQSLDPHSVYLDGKKLRDLEDQTDGEFGGLGIEITLHENGYILIVTPLDETPAAAAGLQTGDLIISIDGKTVLGKPLGDSVELMRGKPGTKIVLEILRGDSETFDIELTRAIIKTDSVRSEMKAHDIGYIRVTNFNGSTANDLGDAVSSLKGSSGKSASGYILDLRNNPGGLLDQAVSVADSFLHRGEIVTTRGRDNKTVSRFQARKGDIIGGSPLVVLINSGSASASEIVAGALQDHGRALIIGSSSFGKGSVQTIIPLSHPRLAIKLTTQRYYTPSGSSIQARGIFPDIEVLPSDVTVLPQGRKFFEADYSDALENPDGSDSDVPVDDSEVEDDYVLQRALEILRAIILDRRSSDE